VTITTFSFNPSIILDSSFDLPLCYSRISSHTITVIPIGKGTESTGAFASVCVGLARDLQHFFNSNPTASMLDGHYRYAFDFFSLHIYFSISDF